jgi:hypothetical protein
MVYPRLLLGHLQVEHPLQKAFDLRQDISGLVMAPDDADDEVISVMRIEQSFCERRYNLGSLALLMKGSGASVRS